VRETAVVAPVGSISLVDTSAEEISNEREEIAESDTLDASVGAPPDSD